MLPAARQHHPPPGVKLLLRQSLFQSPAEMAAMFSKVMFFEAL